MQNNMRDRFVELLGLPLQINVPNQIGNCDTIGERTLRRGDCERLADHLIANGVIVPPCEVGDTVYEVSTGYVNPELRIFERIVSKVEIVESNCILYYCPWKEHKEIGEYCYPTREQAEQKLKEMRGE